MSQSIASAEAFAALVDANRSRIERIARSYAQGADAEDLIQDILLELWRSRKRFRGDASAETWLYRVALNTAATFCRKRARQKPRDAGLPKHTVGEPRDPRDLMREFLGELNDTNRSTLLMFLEGFEAAQIANVLGCTPGAAAVRLTRIKQQFEKTYLEAA